DSDGGSAPASQTVAANAAITIPGRNTLTKAGYVFAGWNSASDGTGLHYAAGSSMTVNQSVILYAWWTESYPYTTPIDYRETETIPALTIPESGVTLGSYKMAKYETTYELWYEVKTWAESHGYSFANAGREDNLGTDGTVPTNANKTKPVTYIFWWDAVVWCNAYSEMSGKTPVYTMSGATLKNAASPPSTLPTMDTTQNGYRLPTLAEWDAAARGGDPSNTTHWNYTYAGSNTIDDVAWYYDNSGLATHPVGQKAANLLGLYDMCGNAQEWCWDQWGSNVQNRRLLGGSCLYNASYCTISDRRSYWAWDSILNQSHGFRVCESVPAE
ncbi:MAG: SUMF1/EgtB/PvdO family nonheme iron enzyme, partial [Treponema sp.]|nr:SUMF1/EgtB/PvdO family nonheme iron enzyme [Treponema sp.]